MKLFTLQIHCFKCKLASVYEFAVNCMSKIQPFLTISLTFYMISFDNIMLCKPILVSCIK